MPPTGSRYDDIADFYAAETGDDVSDPATAATLALLGDVTGMRLLDLACGQGRVSRELARRGARVVGIDLSSALLEEARAGRSPAAAPVTRTCRATPPRPTP